MERDTFDQRLPHLVGLFRAWAKKWTRDPAEIDDIVQQTSLMALEKLHQLRSDDEPQILSWLHRVEYSVFASRVRKRKILREVTGADATLSNVAARDSSNVDGAIADTIPPIPPFDSPASEEPLLWFNELTPLLPAKLAALAAAFVEVYKSGDAKRVGYAQAIADLSRSRRCPALGDVSPKMVRRYMQSVRSTTLKLVRWSGFSATFDAWDTGRVFNIAEAQSHLMRSLSGVDDGSRRLIGFWDEMAYFFSPVEQRQDDCDVKALLDAPIDEEWPKAIPIDDISRYLKSDTCRRHLAENAQRRRLMRERSELCWWTDKVPLREKWVRDLKNVCSANAALARYQVVRSEWDRRFDYRSNVLTLEGEERGRLGMMMLECQQLAYLSLRGWESLWANEAIAPFHKKRILTFVQALLKLRRPALPLPYSDVAGFKATSIESRKWIKRYFEDLTQEP